MNQNVLLVENILTVFLSNQYFQKWKSFLEDNASTYNKSINNNCDYTHEQYDIYNKYNELLESLLNKCCLEYHVSIQQFYHTCKELNDIHNPIVEVFCTLILSSTEIEMFSDIIQKKDKREYFYHIIESWRVTLNSNHK